MTLAERLKPLLSGLLGGASGQGARGLVGPVLIMAILAMMVLPLPAFALDLLFTFNIALSIMVLLADMNRGISIVVLNQRTQAQIEAANQAPASLTSTTPLLPSR